MSKSYVSNITTPRLVDKPITAARITVPKGKYIIMGKLFIIAIPIKDVLLVDQIISAKLVCGTSEDEVLVSIFPRNPSWGELSTSIQRLFYNDDKMERFYPYAGQSAVLPFNLAVSLDQAAKIELNVLSGYAKGIRVESANITALEVDELSVINEVPSNEADGMIRFRTDKIDAILEAVKLSKEGFAKRRRGVARRLFDWLFE